MVKETRNTMIIGRADPNDPKCRLVPARSAPKKFPKIAAEIAHSTFYRYDPKKRRIVCLVTVGKDGLHIAWDTCHACALSIRRCKCKAVQPVPWLLEQITPLKKDTDRKAVMLSPINYKVAGVEPPKQEPMKLLKPAKKPRGRK